MAILLNFLPDIYFNPHSRKGSDTAKIVLTEALEISIHTPARGVTDIPYVAAYLYDISIHTPARGVTKTHTLRQGSCGNFNPHSRKGSDNSFKKFCHFFKNFNPHSRKGSDNGTYCKMDLRTYFNPHSRKGSDS